MTDNVAVLQGFTVAIEAHILYEAYDLFLLVKPYTDYDGAFRAWDTDSQEFIRVNGWLFIVHETD